MKCDELICKENLFGFYSESGPVDVTGSNAITFVNFGTADATVNGFPVLAGTSVSFGSYECSKDDTRYNLSFGSSGTRKMWIVRGHNSVQLSKIIDNASGGNQDVNIHDSAGNNLNSTGGALHVLDSAVLSAINDFATQNNLDLVDLTNALNDFATQNNSDLVDLINAVNDFATQNNIDLVSIDDNITSQTAVLSSFKTENNTNLGNILTELQSLVKVKISTNGVFPLPVDSEYVENALGFSGQLSTVFSGVTASAGQVVYLSMSGFSSGQDYNYNPQITLAGADVGESIIVITPKGVFVSQEFFNSAAVQIICGAAAACTATVFNISDFNC